MHSFTEENYLKSIYKLQEDKDEPVANSVLARALNVNAASVTDMLKKMAEKKLIHYEKSRGFRLTAKGKQVAVAIIRKHRLWEVFLVEKLKFKWDEVHDIAEQLEHIQSEDLVNRLDEYLDRPRLDPHGDPIPNANGVFAKSRSVPLTEMKKNESGKFVGVTDHSAPFLAYLDKLGLSIGDTIRVRAIEEFDNSYTLLLKGKKETTVSHKVANSLLIAE